MSSEPTGTLREDAGALPWQRAADLRVDPLDAQLARERIGGALFADAPTGFALGRYLVLERLGAGAMGIVYAAHDPKLGRRIALKLLRTATLRADRSALARFEREARSLAMVAHPNVVTVHDVGTIDGEALPEDLRNALDPFGDSGPLVFIAMEHVDGLTLGRWASERARPWREVLAHLVQAGRGLQAVHAAGLVHRDVKPENFMIDRGPDHATALRRVRLMDFGLARMGDPASQPELDVAPTAGDESGRDPVLTGSGAQLGTPAYMAPEQHMGLPSDARSDQFSYCATLFELLYGTRPFIASNLFELAVAKSEGTIVEPARRRHVPHWLHAAIVRGLSARPEDRWPSMAALLDELERRPSRTRTTRFAIGGLALAVATGTAGMLLARADDGGCDGAPERVDAIAGDAALRELSRQLAAIDTGHADESAERIRGLLQHWREAWIAERREACEASVVRGEQSQAQLDRRISCLERRRREAAALVGVLRDADEPVLAHGVAAARALRDPSRCATEADSDALPDDDAPAKVAIRERLAEATALYAAGRYDDGLALARVGLDEARTEGDGSLVARAGVILGQIEAELSQREQARTNIEDAYFAALGEQDRATAVQAALLLAQLEGTVFGRTDEGLRWIRFARAQLDPDGDPELAARVEHANATMLGAAGDPDDAIAGYERAVELYRTVPGTELDVGRELGSIGLELAMAHRSAEAVDYLRRGLAIEEDELGPEHPWVALTMGDLAEAERQLGDYEAAEQHLVRALAITRASHGDDHWLVAQLQTNLGIFLVGAKRTAEGLPLLQDALAWYERNPETHRVGAALSNIGHAYATAGDHAAAIPWFARALAFGERDRGTDDPELAYPLLGLARGHLALGHPDLALPFAARGHALCVAAPLHDSLCATLAVVLARALWDTGGDRARARELATNAETVFAAGSEVNGEALAEVRAWLREHPASE